MRGRLGNIKKSFILNYLLLFFVAIFISLIFLNIYVIPYPTFWFYAFCLLTGLFEIIKSRFFKLDSVFYLGTLIFFIGLSGFIFLFTNTFRYLHIYILADFFIASFLTFLVCGQKFHLVIDYLIFFVLIFTLLYTFSIISLPIFIAILCSFLVLLIVIIIINFIWS